MWSRFAGVWNWGTGVRILVTIHVWIWVTIACGADSQLSPVNGFGL
jgi:hypothetical protein